MKFFIGYYLCLKTAHLVNCRLGIFPARDKIMHYTSKHTMYSCPVISAAYSSISYTLKPQNYVCFLTFPGPFYSNSDLCVNSFTPLLFLSPFLSLVLARGWSTPFKSCSAPPASSSYNNKWLPLPRIPVEKQSTFFCKMCCPCTEKTLD